MMGRGLAAFAIGAVLTAASVSASAPTPAPRTYTVTIDKMKFGPVPSGLRVGDTIIWVNRDLFRHTATAADRSFEVDLMPAKSGKLVLQRPGTIAFFCRFHPGMRGRLIVGR